MYNTIENVAGSFCLEKLPFSKPLLVKTISRKCFSFRRKKRENSEFFFQKCLLLRRKRDLQRQCKLARKRNVNLSAETKTKTKTAKTISFLGPIIIFLNSRKQIEMSTSTLQMQIFFNAFCCHSQCLAKKRSFLASSFLNLFLNLK